MVVHFIAIGGAAMHNLALDLLVSGDIVTGSDDEIYDPALTRLKNAGICPEKFGWFPEKLHPGIDVVILGMHAKKDNPELARAKELGLQIVSYPEFIGERSGNKKRVVVAGSHGKTTTTAIILHVLKFLKMDADFLVGSAIEGFDRMVKLTDSPLIVIEGDEYLSSPMDLRPKIHHYKPHISILTGIAWDHINVFPSFEIYKEQFAIFLRLHEPGAFVFYDGSDGDVFDVVKSCERSDIHFIAYEPIEINDSKQIEVNGKLYKFPMIGHHNLKNASAARHVCSRLGVLEDDFFRALESFTGAKKRLQLLWQNHDSQAYLDFAHAPSKLKATIGSVKEWFGKRKLIAFFELHTFSSLNKDFLEQYKDSMKDADEAFVFFDEHTLQMKGMPELPAELVEECFGRGQVHVINSKAALHERITSYEYKSSVVLFMSSGTFGGFDFIKFSENKN